MDNSIKITPIGFLSTEQKYKYQQPRQGLFANNIGIIKLLKHNNFETALEDLNFFSKIWVIYQFDQNSGWRPKAAPPLSPDGKRKGLFATRSPYRPNPIGLSAVDLVSINGLNIEIANFDLLDKTPILDIKPYIPRYDSHPDATSGWLENINDNKNSITFSELAQKQSLWIKKYSGFDLFDFINIQLSTDALNSKRKRINKIANNSYQLSFRTWRIFFLYNEKSLKITITNIESGYSKSELSNSKDEYNDKEVHKDFIRLFNM